MKSWDCFDTIIGRKHLYPRSIFHIVSKKIKDPSFISKRIMAERKSLIKTYDNIYKLLPEYDPNVELETEIALTFPIRVNFDKIQDGDIIVSDMYLNANQIDQILRHHGLNKNIKIYSSPHGKRNGNMWQYLTKKYNIDLHTGDNLQSDIINAKKFNISTSYFPGRLLTDLEKNILNISPELSYLMRFIRLSCPYHSEDDSFSHDSGSMYEFIPGQWIQENNGVSDHSIIKLQSYNNFNNIKWNNALTTNLHQKKLWIDQSQYNIPILITIAKLLPKNIELIFTERDCWYLKLIYDTLFNTNSKVLHTSRGSYRNPYSEEYIKYIQTISKDSMIVDLYGSCNSPARFFNKYNESNNKQKIFYSYFCPTREKFVNNNLDIKYLIRKNNFKGRRYGRALEKFNMHNIGPLVSWENNMPIRSNKNFQKNIAQEEAILYCIKHLLDFNITINNNNNLGKLIHSLCNTYTNSIIKLKEND